jgi:hypothetical protein
MKFKYCYIDKIKVQTRSPALKKGSYFHYLIEKHGLTNELEYDIEPELKEEVDLKMKNFLKSDLSKYVEMQTIGIELPFGIKKDFTSTNYYNKEALIRGYIDRVAKDENNNYYIIDWKSGKAKDLQYQSFDQALVYGIWFFQTFKEIDAVTLVFAYVEAGKENILTINRSSIRNHAKFFADKIRTIETTEDFKCNVTKLCDYCDYKEICPKN